MVLTVRPSGRVLRVGALAVGILLLAFVFALGWDAGSTSRVVADGAAGSAVGIPGPFLAEGTLRRLQERISRRPQEAAGYRDLGVFYLQRARETADPGYYTRAEAALSKALELHAEDADTFIAIGTLALARHQFREALDWGEAAKRLNPSKAGAYGVIGDAQVELGRNEEALAAMQRMVDLRPDLTSYARVSYLRELHGDLQGAIQAMKMAADVGETVGSEPGAWARVHLGLLFWTYRGTLEETEREYRRALFNRPDYAPALAGLARVAAARGAWQDAEAYAHRAATLLPLPEHVILLGDLLRALGRTEEAAQQDALVGTLDRLARSAGIDTDLEVALFQADQGEDLETAVAAAWRGYQRRPSVKAADVLAWALYKAGRVEEARPFMAEAFAWGSLDPLAHYHAAKIALAVGDQEGAAYHLRITLSANPHFSFRYAEDARHLFFSLTKGDSS